MIPRGILRPYHQFWYQLSHQDKVHTCYVAYWDYYEMLNIMLTLHAYGLTFSGENDGGVTGKKAAKPVTAVQDCVLSVKPQAEE